MKLNRNILLTFDSVEQIKERLKAQREGKEESSSAPPELDLTAVGLLSDRIKQDGSTGTLPVTSQRDQSQ